MLYEKKDKRKKERNHTKIDEKNEFYVFNHKTINSCNKTKPKHFFCNFADSHLVKEQE